MLPVAGFRSLKVYAPPVRGMSRKERTTRPRLACLIRYAPISPIAVGTSIALAMGMTSQANISDAFRTFLTEAPKQSKVWMEAVERLGQANALDSKTMALCYLSALATARLTSGVPFHAARARAAGATRDEVIGAILSGLPAVGNTVIESLAPALQAFNE